jgi:hypothetical protein
MRFPSGTAETHVVINWPCTPDITTLDFHLPRIGTRQGLDLRYPSAMAHRANQKTDSETAVITADQDILRVWDENAYRWHACLVTKGARHDQL